MPTVYCDPRLPSDYDPAELQKRAQCQAERSLDVLDAAVYTHNPLRSIRLERARITYKKLADAFVARRDALMQGDSNA